jgi:AcrR family transcriptional regulator
MNSYREKMTARKTKKLPGSLREKSSGNRERILAVALHLFTINGFHATPTEQIIKESNLSSGTLFHYFPDKNSLIDQVYLSVKKELAETIRANDDENLPIAERVECLVRGYVAWGTTNPEKFRFIGQFCNSPNIGEDVKKEGYQEFVRLHEIIDTAVREGYFPEMPHAYYSVMLGQVLSGILILIERGNSNLTQEEIIRSGLDMLRKH